MEDINKNGRDDERLRIDTSNPSKFKISGSGEIGIGPLRMSSGSGILTLEPQVLLPSKPKEGTFHVDSSQGHGKNRLLIYLNGAWKKIV